MLRANAGAIQPGGDGVHRQRVALPVLQRVTREAVDGAFGAEGERGGMVGGVEPFAAGFDANQPDRSVGQNSVNMPIALEPPPTQAVTTSGNLFSSAMN